MNTPIRISLVGGFRKLGYPFGGPHSKGYCILAIILGSHDLWKLPGLGGFMLSS